MKMLRWGMVVALVGSTVLLSGCAYKLVPRGQYEELMQLKDINQEQASLITSLINEKDKLTRECAGLQARLGTTTDLIEAQKKIIDNWQERVNTGPTVAGTESTELIPTSEGPMVRLAGDVLFAAGQAALTPEGERLLKEKIIPLVAKEPNSLAVNGFSDSDPIRASGWKSNFDLSGARALAVLEFMRKQGIDANRMHFRGYGEHRLIMESGKENKKKSRRVEIVLLNPEAELNISQTHSPAPMKAPVPK